MITNVSDIQVFITFYAVYFCWEILYEEPSFLDFESFLKLGNYVFIAFLLCDILKSVTSGKGQYHGQKD